MLSLAFCGPTWRMGTDEFRRHCPYIIMRIRQRDETVIILDDERPLAQITRYEQPALAGYGSLKGKVEILGDIEGPMPVEWYTDPDVQTSEDCDTTGQMPASGFIQPDEVKRWDDRMLEPVDVSLLQRHDFLTVNVGEFVAQLDEIVVAVSGSNEGVVAVFDDEKGLVQMTRYRQNLGGDPFPLILAKGDS